MRGRLDADTSADIGRSRPIRPASLVLAILALIWPTVGRAVAADDAPVTFTENVAAVVFKNCTSCHRPGEGTPFTLTSYSDVKKRGHLIRDVIGDGYMPPWPPAEGWGHFQDERRLSKDEIALIDRWVEAGMPEGPADKLPPLPTFAPGGWSLGKPDMVVTLPEPFEIPADGRDIYRMFVLPLNLDEDKWVTAVEIRPTARSVVHHAIYFLDSTGASRKLDEADPGQGFSRMGFPRTGSLGGWAVGATPRHLPMDLAYPLPKQSDLVVQIHFHPSGKAEREQTSFGLYFAKKAPKKKLLGMQAPQLFGIGTELRTKGIKPGEKDFTIRGEWKVPFDIDVVSAGGHAHYICTKMKAIAELPDGKELKLFAIDDWDFNWQGRYNYAEPVRLPKGAIVRTTLVYDNSADNPRNPSNPPVHVRWGEGSTDEMGAVGLAFVAVNESDIASYRGPATFSGGDTGGRLGAGGRGALLRNGMLQNAGPERLLAIFDVLDADKNGKLEGEEIPDRLQPFMGRIDSNGDGALDRPEIEALRPASDEEKTPGAKPMSDATPRRTRLLQRLAKGVQSRMEPSDPKVDRGPRMTDVQGRTWTPLQPEAGTKANVLVFVTRDCPVANQYTQEIGRIARDYAGKGISFLVVHVDPETSADSAREHAKEYGLDLPILLDPKHDLVAKTGAKVTPEAAIISPEAEVVYCGRIDDRFGKLGRQRPAPSQNDLRDAIDALLAGRTIPNPKVAAIGCPIADLRR
ncbi:redoxin domain-containing protein [Singulisphaera sp. PoT]|uniref:redoxin domain-containing protein n=1 Tax=Singulisphaera sp. PoT TaxID=3411797 RepID=UPI003BF5EDDE